LTTGPERIISRDMPQTVEQNIDNCRRYIECGERERAYGEMATILEHYQLLGVDIPFEAEVLYGILFIGDGVRALREAA